MTLQDQPAGARRWSNTFTFLAKVALIFYCGYFFAILSENALIRSEIRRREFTAERIKVSVDRVSSLAALIPCGFLFDSMSMRSMTTSRLHAVRGSLEQWGEIFDEPADTGLEDLECRSDATTVVIYNPKSNQVVFIFPK